MNKWSLLFSSLIVLVRLSHGAPCCGGTANVPSLIVGDDRAQISTTISNANIIADAPVGGGIQYRSDSDTELAQTIRLDAATLITDRFQLGVTFPIVRRSRTRGITSAEATGLGDSALNLGFEILPEWEYNPWRPRGFIFLTTTFPTGGSIYDATQPYRIDSRGRGFFSLSAGALLTKVWGNWDASLLLEGHRAFSRTVSNELGDLVLIPGWGSSGTISLGVSPLGGNIRIGVALSPSHEDPVSTQGILDGSGEKVVIWTNSIQFSYLASDDISMSATYSDQTWIRSSENSALNRTIALLFQKRWGR